MNPHRDKRHIWDRKDVAAHIGCSLPHVLKCVRELGLPHLWLGKLLRFRREDVLRWITEQIELARQEADKATKQKGAA